MASARLSCYFATTDRLAYDLYCLTEEIRIVEVGTGG
jgi:hypothetical protein